ncbi:MAG: sulfatase-like hydrolase/transferase [Verrucomicrobiota bacterium]
MTPYRYSLTSYFTSAPLAFQDIFRSYASVAALLFVAISVSLSSAVAEQDGENSKPPNFLVILTDDQAFDDYGQDGKHAYLETPNLDRLRKESVHLTNYRVMPVCAPTRAALLTGRHPWRTGVTVVGYGWSFIKLDEVLFPEILQVHGYQTGMWGKWHCGLSDGYYPWDRGFEEAYMTQGYEYRNNFGFLNSMTSRVDHRKYSMEVLSDYAIDFIERHQEEPFCAYLPYITPHSEYVAIPPLWRKYNQKGLSSNLAKLYGTLEFFDINLGRVLDKLEELGLDENTVIIYHSDNGPNLTNADAGTLSPEDWAIRNPSQLRGNKANTWENGIKTPCFVRWKGTLVPREVDVATGVTDLFPTIMDLAGIEHRSAKKQDGKSLVPLLEETSKDSPAYKELENRFYPTSHQAVVFQGRRDKNLPFPDDYRNVIRFEDQSLVGIKGGFKLIQKPIQHPHPFNPQPEADADHYILIDLENDPTESSNVIKQHPELADNMKTALRDWFSDVVADENFGQRPEFIIGHQGKEKATVSVRSASQVGGQFTNVTPSFERVGDFGEFNLIVGTPGTWELSLNHSPTTSAGKLKVSIGHQSFTVKPSGNATEAGTFKLTQRGEKLTLRIEAVSPGSGQQPILTRLVGIELNRAGS